MAAKGIDPASLDTYEKARDAALAISDPSKNQFGWGFSPYAVGDKKLGMWLFICADSLTFAACLVAYSYVRLAATAWPRRGAKNTP